MLENIRKYSALMVIVLALLAFGLIVTLNQPGQSGSAGNIISIDGDGITEAQFQKEYETLPSLAQVNEIHPVYMKSEIRQYMEELDTLIISKDVDARYYRPLAQIIINQEAEKLGIFVSTEDAIKHIETQLFADEEGKLDATRYNKFADKTLKQFGMSEADYRAVVRNMLTLKAVLNTKSPLGLPVQVRAKIDDINKQTVDSIIVQFSIDQFTNGQEPNEEQLRAFYDANKTNKADKFVDAFWTKKKLKLAYIPVNLEAIPELKKGENEVDIELAKAKQERDFKSYKKFSRDDANVGDSPDIEALAKKYNLDYATTELVSADQLKIANLPIKGEKSRFGSLHNYLYSSNIRKTNKVSLNVFGGHKPSYLHYQILEKVEPELKSFEDSKEALIKLVKEDLAHKAMVKAAEEAKEKLAGVADIKSEIEALKLTSFEVAALHAQTEELGLELAAPLAKASSLTNSKQISDVVSNASHAGFAYVIKREVEKADGYEAFDLRRDNQISQSMGNLATYEWASTQFKKAQDADLVVVPKTQEK